MKNQKFKWFNEEETKKLLPFGTLVSHLETTIKAYAKGQIVCPSRSVTPLTEGGIMLSMPAVSSKIAIHKLVNICPSNRDKNIPTLHGSVTVFDPITGIPLFALDASTLTSRRTAAISMVGIKLLYTMIPHHILIIGTGAQTISHILAIQEIFPTAKISVKGRSRSNTQAFCKALNSIMQLEPWNDKDDPDVVITVTTSKTPVYAEAAKVGRLIIGVGVFTPDAAEIAKDTVKQSLVIVDDPMGAKHEAGDIILSGMDWKKVFTLAEVIMKVNNLTNSSPIFFKSVGCAAWDLGACEVAKSQIISPTVN